MKPWVLRKIDDLLSITGILKTTGNGQLFLADNGQYISAQGNAVAPITEFLATAHDQIINITVAAGFVYVVNSDSYKNIKVKLTQPPEGSLITIKNTNNEGIIKILNEIDGYAEFELDAHNAITICYTSSTGWIILEDHLISYAEKHKITQELDEAVSRNGGIYYEAQTDSFRVNFDTDNRKFFECEGTFTVYLPDAELAPKGFNCYIKNNSTGIITVETATYGQRIDVETKKEVTTNECIHIISAGDKYVSSHTASWIAP